MNTQSLVPSIFNYHQHPVRSVLIEQEPWFAAKDVCDALELQNSRDIVRRHLDDDERTVYGFHTPSRGTVKMTVVNMSGLYALMFRSQKPKAKAFRKWITGEVLPSLSDSGSYTLSNKELPQPAPKALSTGLPTGVLDARGIPTTTVGLLGGKVRMVSVEGKQWYCLRDVMQCAAAGGNGRLRSYMQAHRLPVQHRTMAMLFAAPAAAWFVTETGVRLLLGARGLLTSQLTLNLANQA